MGRRKKSRFEDTGAVQETSSEIRGVVMSRVDSPVILEYDGEETRVSPRQVLRKIVFSKLQDPLPKGLVFIRNG